MNNDLAIRSMEVLVRQINELEAELGRCREALTRIYQSGRGEHVEIAREALNRA